MRMRKLGRTGLDGFEAVTQSELVEFELGLHAHPDTARREGKGELASGRGGGEGDGRQRRSESERGVDKVTTIHRSIVTGKAAGVNGVLKG